jgi:hypothetical protein
VLRAPVISSSASSYFSANDITVSGPINGQEILNSNNIHSLPDIRLTVDGNNTFDLTAEAVITLVLDNVGSSNAGPFTVAYDWGDGIGETKNIDGLTTGDSMRINISHRYTTAGQYFVNVIANSNRSVRESSETNNSKRAFIQINQNQGLSASSACSTTCNIGEKRCSGNGVSTCQRGSDGCPLWTQAIACLSTESCAGGSCRSATTYSTPAGSKGNCADSDGGAEIFVAGYALEDQAQYFDYCKSSTSLFELTCDVNGHKEYQTFDCAYGCKNGACKLAP